MSKSGFAQIWDIERNAKRSGAVKHNKFTSAVILTPEAGLASDCQTALRHFGLKKLAVVTEFGELQKQIIEHSFAIILIDVDSLDESDQKAIVGRLRSTNNHKQGLFVALARLNSREELFELKKQGFASVLIKPLSIGMMEQALNELIERQRTEPVDRQSLIAIHEQFLRGQTFEADRTLSIWLEREPESLEGLTLLGFHQFRKQEFYRASQTISRALKIKPDYLPALHIKIRISLRLGQLDDAFQALAREERTRAILDAKLAESLAHTLSAVEKAERTFCEEFATREGITTLLINLGLQLSKTGKPEESLQLYSRALGPMEDENAFFIALFNRGKLYLNSKYYPEAQADLTNARELAPAELHQKIDELLMLCNSPVEDVAEILADPATAAGKIAIPDLLSMPLPEKKAKSKYKPFNKDEVLQLVFLGMMKEETVPPESVEEWLQIKNKLLHILFLEELPFMDKKSDVEADNFEPAGQGAT
jgi:tetratricopeptide (TPR) repeat protein